jgi:hypothetical protein
MRKGGTSPVPFVARTIHFNSGERVETNEGAGVRSTEKERWDLNQLMDPGDRCLRSVLGNSPSNRTILNEDEVSGYRTIRIRQGRVDMWLAPALNCALIQMRVSRTPGSAELSVTKDPLLIKAGEPDEALFRIPDSYREVPASTILGLPKESPEGRSADAAYRAHQAARR